MSVHEHREAAPARPVNVWVVTVSSTRTAGDDPSGDAVSAGLTAAGHAVLDRTVVKDDVEAIRALVRGLAGDGTTEVVVLTGGTGVSLDDVTPEALAPLFTRQIPGFGELFRMLSYKEIGGAAMLSRATAGMVGPIVVFALPGSPNAARLGVELIAPDLAHLVRELTKEGHAEAPPRPGVAAKPAVSTTVKQAPAAKPAAKEPAAKKEPEKPALPAPTGSLGRLGRLQFNVGTSQDAAAAPAEAADSADLPSGWLRAVYEIRGEITKGTYPEIPEELEKVAPVVDTLHTSGARGTMKLPSGRTFALFGWPNLEKGAKVLAIADGSPIAEVLALHRWPAITGTCLDEAYGLGPKRSDDVAKIAEAVCGLPPKDTSGQVFAVQGDAVWIQRGGRAFRWDGHKEKDDGTPKQVLASLVHEWVSR